MQTEPTPADQPAGPRPEFITDDNGRRHQLATCGAPMATPPRDAAKPTIDPGSIVR